MSVIRLYLDEDSMDRLLVQALRARSVDVITVNEAATGGFIDEQQFRWATSQGRVLFSHNIGDFCRLHAQFLSEGLPHAGIALLQQDYSIGEQVRGIMGLVTDKTVEEMQNQLVFLNQYLRL